MSEAKNIAKNTLLTLSGIVVGAVIGMNLGEGQNNNKQESTQKMQVTDSVQTQNNPLQEILKNSELRVEPLEFSEKPGILLSAPKGIKQLYIPWEGVYITGNSWLEKLDSINGYK